MTALRPSSKGLSLVVAALLLVAASATTSWAKVIAPVSGLDWSGMGTSTFDSPWGLDLDTAGNGFVADTENDRVVKVSPAGAILTTWGSPGSGSGQFRRPRDVAVDGAGNIFVADTGNDRVQVLNSGGGFVTQWGTSGSGDGQFNDPTSVDVDDAGNVYVADAGNNRVQKFSSAGLFLAKWGTPGTGKGQFQDMRSLAVGPADTLYVTDGYTVQKFSTSGAFKTRWGSKTGWMPPDPGEFSTAYGVAVDSAGNVYVSDSTLVTIQKFDPSGAPLDMVYGYGGTAGRFVTPAGLATDGAGDVYVAERGNSRIQELDSSLNHVGFWGWGPLGWLGGAGDIELTPSGDVLALSSGNLVRRYSSAGVLETSWGGAGTQAGEFDGPSAIAIDSGGDVYVSDSGNNRIQKFDADGKFLDTWGSYGPGNGEFVTPTGIDVDSSGDVYVVDAGNARVQKFSSSGAFLTAWGSYGGGDGQFESPMDLAVTPSGNILVVDNNYWTVQEFGPDGTFVTRWPEGTVTHQPNAITTDQLGNIYVVEQLGGAPVTVERFTPTGVPMGSWPTDSYGIAVDDSFRVFTPRGGYFPLAPSIVRWDPSAALTIKAPKSVPKGSKATVSGSLNSSHTECFQGATVTLMRGVSTLGTQLTTATGAYKFSLKITKKTTVHVEFAGSTFETTGTCPAAASINKTIKPT